MTALAPCLMFCGEQCGRAQDAVERYVSAFPDSRIDSVAWDDDGRITHGRITLAGREVVVMDGPGPHEFTFTPATSLFVDLDSEDEFERAYAVLSEGATILMPAQEYPFSPRFCWLNDRYGVSWQLHVVRNESA